MTHPETIPIVVDAADPVAGAAPVRWAVEQLQQALAAHGLSARTTPRAEGSAGEPCILVGGRESAPVRDALGNAGATLPDAPESVALVPATVQGRSVTLATGSDVRGVVYAVLELADRVANAAGAGEAQRALRVERAVVERPANEIRSLMRLFTSDVEDLGWYHDREFWTSYLSMLAAQRYNRFHLAMGIGFDFARHMRDTYFYFAYPFLVDVPGYDVRATGVSAAERERNLDTLRFVAAETKRRGLHFQLGVWANVYVFEDSPEVNHRIEGLNAENHAPYCRDAIRLLLEQVPDVDGLTIRIHGESGIPEGSYDFWRTLFSGVAACGRRVELDLHAKGIDQQMIDLALETGLPVIVSPKFWAEHLGLPYHQAEIRAVERPGQPAGQHARLMALSIGSRRFTRYGYADLLPEDRRFGVLFRVWPGTNRLLLWGDPATGRGYGRAFGFAGANGVDLFEPLSFSGRRGSGLPDGRNPYAGESLRPDGPHGDWQKYLYEYRLWGRLLYNPDADPEVWRRWLTHTFGTAAGAMEAALASASRIMPLVTTAHHPSAANNSYWPEVYTNMPIVDEARKHPFGDTAPPKRFGNVSALDPELFSSAEGCVEEALSGQRSGRYTPLEVAGWLEGFAREAVHRLAEAERTGGDPRSGEFRRWALDIRVEAGLGRFFAAKFQAAVGYTLFTRTGDVESLREAVACYRAARDAWVEVVEQTRGTYKPDLTFGPEAHLRGHWADRLPAIEADVQDMERALQQAEAGGAAPHAMSSDGNAGVTFRRLLAERRPEVTLRDETPGVFTPGQPLVVEVVAAGASRPAGAVLRYRHVNQAERFQSAAMEPGEGEARFHATIPGGYTDSRFPLQYYVELHLDGAVTRWPGFLPDLSNQPYVVVRAIGAKPVPVSFAGT